MHRASKIVHKFAVNVIGLQRQQVGIEEKRTSVETNCRRTAEVVMGQDVE